MMHPIIIAAFGTTSRSRAVYEEVDRHLKARFAGHDIHWAYTSRTIRHRLKKRDIETLDPATVLARLADQGHPWAVVQSFNMICGHEFYRLVNDVQHPACRVSVGHSLLCSQEDHQAVVEALAPVFARDESEAVVLVGHGTDHCAWTTYPAFSCRLRQIYGTRAFVGMIEDGWPDRDVIIRRIVDAGFRRVRLMPFMLVAGVHFAEDLAGPEDSWKTALEAHGIQVALESEAMGSRGSIIDIFATHIRGALAVIPVAEARKASNPIYMCDRR
ncbi:MAG: sirohydrochlorin cobaltochelatase [Thermodesulfobacteriota bacterium]|jgi:sirohydrochlorin cobaltochelatase|nr:sirohydrochlorin cobaltochelatase [Thermodesulfobacteriota bacterium]